MARAAPSALAGASTSRVNEPVLMTLRSRAVSVGPAGSFAAGGADTCAAGGSATLEPASRLLQAARVSEKASSHQNARKCAFVIGRATCGDAACLQKSTPLVN